MPRSRTRGRKPASNAKGRYTPLPKQWLTTRQPEVKQFSSNFTGINGFGGTTADITHWSAITAGFASNEHVGQKIQPYKLECHLNLSLSSGLTGGRFARFMLIQWFELDSALPPTVADVLQDTTSGAALVNSGYKRSVRRVYRVLYDSTSTLYDAKPAMRAVITRSGRQLAPITFEDDGHGVTGIGQIYSITVCDAPSSPGDVKLSVALKLAYTDA